MSMKFGCNLYKFIHYGNDIAGTREFVLTADKLGYHHVRLLDHVVGLVNEKHGGNWKYHSKTTLHEIFTLLGYFSAIEHMGTFSRGVIDTRPIVFYLSMTVVMLALTHQAFQSRKWRL